jgi:pimeloyl-ACP methyl ester carboxylesterase
MTATGTLLGYRHDLRTARAQLTALQPRRIETPYGMIQYADQGDGPVVLVVHGIFGGFDAGLRLARLLVPDGFRSIVPSRFGYLGSTLPPNPSPALQADAFAALLDLLGVTSAAVIGVSAGATSALQLALRHPQRVAALLLVSHNVPGPHHDHPPLPRPLARLVWGSDLLMWCVLRFMTRAILNLMGVPKGLPLTQADRAVIQGELNLLPVSQRIDGIIFDAFASNPDINRATPIRTSPHHTGHPRQGRSRAALPGRGRRGCQDPRRPLGHRRAGRSPPAREPPRTPSGGRRAATQDRDPMSSQTPETRTTRPVPPLQDQEGPP